MPQSSRKRSDVRTYVGRMLGAIVRESTATGAGTLGLADTDAVSSSNTYMKGKRVILRPGASTQEFRTLPAFVPATDSWDNVAPNFSNAATSDDAYEIWDESVVTIDQVEASIDMALTKVFHQSGLPVYNDELTVDDLLYGDGQMERLDSSTSIPEGSTASGTATLAKETSAELITRGLSSLKITVTTGNSYTLTWAIDRAWTFGKLKATVKADVWSDKADAIRVQILDGVNTNSSDFHTGDSEFEELTKEATLDDDPTKLEVVLDIADVSATSINYTDNLRLIIQQKQRRYKIKLAIDRISAVIVANARGDFMAADDVAASGGVLHAQEWRIIRGATPELYLPTGRALTADRRIRLVGQETPALWTDDTTTVSLTDEQYTAIIQVATFEALLTKPISSEQDIARLDMWRANSNLWLGRADNREADTRRVR